MDTDPSRWLYDKINENFLQLHRYDEVLYEGRTKYQAIRVVRTRNFGVCLVLDGKVQSSEVDEFIYHEALVHPAMIMHPRPESVFIAGGGEGATLREVLGHRTVKKAIVVDIDKEVTDLCLRHLPGLSQGAFEDSRAQLVHADARAYLEENTEKYDVIILDLPDPIEGGPASRLFTLEFYQLVSQRLGDNGLVAIQAGSASPTELLNLTAVHSTLKKAFASVIAYAAYVPCFGGPWGFCLASLNPDISPPQPKQIDEGIAARGLRHLRFYDGTSHEGMFSLPKYVRQALSSRRRIITDSKLLYLYGS